MWEKKYCIDISCVDRIRSCDVADSFRTVLSNSFSVIMLLTVEST